MIERRSLSLVFVVFAMLAMAPVQARAQMSSSDLTAERVLRVAAAEDWLVRVSSSSGAIVEGEIETVDEQGVVVADTRFAFADVIRIQRGEQVGGGSRTVTFGSALLVGTLFVALTALKDDADFDVGEAGVYALAGITLGAVLGSVLGSEIDPERTQWHHVWPEGW